VQADHAQGNEADAILLRMLHDAAAGRFPPPDFSTTVLPSPSSMRAVADDPVWRPVGSEILYLVRPPAAGGAEP